MSTQPHRTRRNLEAALAGESMAHIKYRWFARLCRAQGDEATARLFEAALDRFHDDESGGFFESPADGEELILRQKPYFDSPTPSGNGAMALLAGCAKDAPQDYFQPEGPNARDIDTLARPVFYIAGVVAVIVIAAVGYAMFKFRDRGQDIPEQTHGNPKLEIALTILPAIILAGIAVPTVAEVFKLDKKDDTACVVNVTGQQWWWEYDYVAGTCGNATITAPIITSGELVLPVDTPVLLRITSRDVIHSFWIPKLNGKRDAVPGRMHTLRMQADEPGIYTGQCTG